MPRGRGRQNAAAAPRADRRRAANARAALPFNRKLILNQWLLGLFGVERFDQLAEHLKDESLEGLDENNIHRFHHALCLHLPVEKRPELPDELLLEYDQAIVSVTQRLNERRLTRGEPQIVGDDTKMQNVTVALNSAAAKDATVLLEGESGTGKELFARALHMLSPRADGPFVAINCAAIPENLLETELFGHEKGAFTGAANRKPGKFELAHRGTLFLDEIGDLPLSLHAKILRALE